MGFHELRLGTGSGPAEPQHIGASREDVSPELWGERPSLSASVFPVPVLARVLL